MVVPCLCCPLRNECKAPLSAAAKRRKPSRFGSKRSFGRDTSAIVQLLLLFCDVERDLNASCNGKQTWLVEDALE